MVSPAGTKIEVKLTNASAIEVKTPGTPEAIETAPHMPTPMTATKPKIANTRTALSRRP